MEVLNAINPYIDWTVLVITAITEVSIFVKLSFKLDFAGIFIAITYISVMLLRILPGQIESAILVTILWPIASNIIWVILYYFIFEMKSVHNKLVSPTFQEHLKREKSTKRTRGITIGIFIVFYMLPAVTTYYIVKEENAFYKEKFNVIIGIIIGSRILKCLIDVFICLEFLSLLGNFLRLKKKALKSKRHYMSSFNTFIARWIYFNFILKALNAFFVLTILTMFQAKQGTGDQDELITFMYNLTLRTMVSITDCLNILTIMYLFYFQGMKEKERLSI